MDPIEQMPAELSRCNWVMLALMLFCSVPFCDLGLSLSILCGGLIAIGGFSWMRRSLERLLEQPAGGARFRFHFGYIIRLATIGIALGLLIAIIRVNIIGLVMGLSTVVLSLFWFTIKRVI